MAQLSVPNTTAQASGVLVVGDVEHLGIAGFGWHEWVHLKFAEAASEIEMVLGGQRLVPEKENFAVHEGGSQGGDDVIGLTFPKVDAGHLRPDCW